MTPLQTLEIRAGDIRGRLSEVAEMELTDELRSELTTLRREYQDNETKQTALKIAGAAPEKPKETDTETREEKERNELRSSVQFGTYVAAAIGGHPVFNGPEAEYNREIGLEGNQFPLELLGRSLETRASGTDGESDTNQGTWLDRVFAESAAMRVGVSMRNVAPGVHPTRYLPLGLTRYSAGGMKLSPSLRVLASPLRRLSLLAVLFTPFIPLKITRGCLAFLWRLNVTYGRQWWTRWIRLFSLVTPGPTKTARTLPGCKPPVLPKPP